MVSSGSPLEPVGSLSDEIRGRGIELLRGLVGTGKVDLHTFELALGELYNARTESDFAQVVRRLPPPVDLTPPERRLLEPLEITTDMGAVRLAGRWQVGRRTEVRSGMGSVTVDLTEAEFDDWSVDLVVHSAMGAVTVIVPRGMAVQLVGRNGAVNYQLERPVPGFPVVRLSVTSDMGSITLRHPRQRRRLLRRWRGRRGRMALPR